MPDMIVVPLTDENRPAMAEFALSMYADEPCRICRRLLTMADLKDGATFAGYSADGTARAAHRVCWQNFEELLRTLPVQRIHELMNSVDLRQYASDGECAVDLGGTEQ